MLYGPGDFGFELPSPDGSDGPFCPGYGLPLSNSRKWNALARLILRAYFERIWVIQEVVMASRAVPLVWEIQG